MFGYNALDALYWQSVAYTVFLNKLKNKSLQLQTGSQLQSVSRLNIGATKILNDQLQNNYQKLLSLKSWVSTVDIKQDNVTISIILDLVVCQY